jgi:hypothetical protein
VQGRGESKECVKSENDAANGGFFITKRKKLSGEAPETYKSILFGLFLNPGFFCRRILLELLKPRC